MGRRLSFHRPKAKVRGIPRRLKALDRWAESFKGASPYIDERYMNYKIPVLDRLVQPPTTTPEIQAFALNALLKAANHLTSSPVKDEVPFYRVAVLLTYPGMFSSEVTVFYCPDYYAGFLSRSEPNSELVPLSKRFDLNIPKGFDEIGNFISYEEEDEDGPYQIEYEQWTIGQPL